MKRKVLVIGDSYMNLQMSVPGAAKSLGTLYGDSYDLHASGPSAVSAITAAKNGADVAFCTKLGNDANGERLMTCFNACRIDTSYVKKSAGLQTGFVFTAYDSMNSNSYVAKGANSALSKADIDDAFACFPDIMLVPQDYMPMSAESYSKSDFENSRIDLEIGTAQENFRQITEPKTSRPDNLALYAINKAMERGVEMVVEYTDKTSLLPLEKIQSGIKIVVISDEMLQKVTGTAPISNEKTLSALIAFSSRIKAKYYVVQKGSDTSFIYDGRYYEKRQLPLSISKYDSGKMNSTYVGAMMAEYLETRDILLSCKYATAVSMMTDESCGIFRHVPGRAEVEQTLKQYGIDLSQL